MPSDSRYSLSMLKLDEISLVDRPANPGAKVAVWKRGDPVTEVDKAMNGEMTDAEKGKMKEYMDGGMSEKDAMARVMREMRKGAGASGETDHDQEDNMDVTELEKKLTDLEAQVTELTKERDDAIAARDAEIAKRDDSDEYIEVGGEKVLKSAVPAPVLKQIESANERIAKMEREAEAVRLAKRADEEIPNLKGTAAERGALLKAVDGIEDEAVRKSIASALKAADAAVKSTFVEVGKSAADDEASATYRLNKMASDYAAEKGVTFEMAYSEVTKDGEGRKLFAASRNEQN